MRNMPLLLSIGDSGQVQVFAKAITTTLFRYILWFLTAVFLNACVCARVCVCVCVSLYSSVLPLEVHCCTYLLPTSVHMDGSMLHIVFDPVYQITLKQEGRRLPPGT